MDFSGQAIVITGGAGGIGLETARQLVEKGASVAIFDLSEAALAKAAETLRHSDRVMTAVADSADTASMESAFNAVTKKFAKLNGLVANAGIRMQSTPVTELEDEVWDQVIRVNLRGVFVAIRGAARIMKKGGTGGSIVTVASLSGQVGRIDQSAYATSKAGAIHLSRVLAVELAGDNIRVNAVCPGTVNTAMLKKAQAQDGEQVLKDRIFGSQSRFRPGIPLRRIAEAEDVASTIVYLMSDGARHVTGQAVSIDGGESVV
jgi:NAD(P)-dependent dehydrogenase (short-subunit alcohol dehydrogenase family)